MIEDFELMLDLMDRSFRDFESPMPYKPVLVKFPFGEAFRYKEKNIYQAIIQKLARVQGLVRAAYVLVMTGLLQEQGILHRAIDETNEDILFLCYAAINNDITDLHKQFLDAFWQEEIDAPTGKIMDSKQNRPMIKRQKITAYISRVEGSHLDESTGNKLGKTLRKAYSGYVHGASSHIMEMYGGDPPQFHTKGMRESPHWQNHVEDLWNYMYRSFLSHILVAKVLGSRTYVEKLNKHRDIFEKKAGLI